jgi:hypothetical protein
VKDSTFVVGGVLAALLISYGALQGRVTADENERLAGLPLTPSEAATVRPTTMPSSVSVPLEGLSDEWEKTLASLKSAPGIRRQDYDRDAFGSSWRDLDINGCNQRDDVLVRDAVPGTVVTGRQGGCVHDVLAGSWIDPYTGRRNDLTDAKLPAQSQAVQIDHVVPLSEAWSSGAWAWSQDRREAFANDLTALLAVDGPTNASKGDDDPAAWRPRKGYQCEYARRWISVKAAWALEVDQSERQAIEEMLGYC